MASSLVRVMIEKSETEQRELKASPRNPKERIDVRSSKEFNFDVQCGFANLEKKQILGRYNNSFLSIILPITEKFFL